MKNVLVSAVAFVAASAANAGSLVYTAPEVISIEEPARMGGSGAWLIPLIIVSVLVLALTEKSEPVQPNGIEPNGVAFN